MSSSVVVRFGPVAGGPQEGPPDAVAAVVGVDRELLEVGAVVDAVDAAEADRWVAGHQDDERGGELLPPCPGRGAARCRGARTWCRPPPRGGQQGQLVRPHGANDQVRGAVALHGRPPVRRRLRAGSEGIDLGVGHAELLPARSRAGPSCTRSWHSRSCRPAGTRPRWRSSARPDRRPGTGVSRGDRSWPRGLRRIRGSRGRSPGPHRPGDTPARRRSPMSVAWPIGRKRPGPVPAYRWSGCRGGCGRTGPGPEPESGRRRCRGGRRRNGRRRGAGGCGGRRRCRGGRNVRRARTAADWCAP